MPNLRKNIIKHLNIYLYISIFFIAITLLSVAIGINTNRQTNDNYINLNDIIENKNSESNLKAYNNVINDPYSFAKYDNEENSAFYIIYDGRYYSIAYLSDELYNKIINNKPITIYGTTTTIPLDVKNMALDFYNEIFKDNLPITIEDFENIFGRVYLDNTTFKISNNTFYFLSIIPFIISLTIFIIYLIKRIKFKKSFNQIDIHTINQIEKELKNNPLAFDKYHLLLTESYIISFNSTIKIIKYSDVIWIYENDFKILGFNLFKNIFITDKKAFKYNIAKSLSKKHNRLKEIIIYISNKNDKMLVGYNPKNQEEINDILKNN